MSEGTLVTKASQGRLSVRELQQVAERLISGSTDPYEALLVIGRANAKQYLNLVEKYLQCREDPMLSRLALQILCRYWGMTAEYQETVEQFVRKVDWDEEDDVRLMAIDCAGSFLAENKSAPLLSLLLQIFRDESERQIVREAAYCSLALAAGKPPNDLPATSRHFDLERDVDRSVIEVAENALREA
jgi:hypothetical protein